MRYIRKKMQREDGHRKNSRPIKESTVKEEESTQTTDIKHSAFWRPSERKTRQRNQCTCYEQEKNVTLESGRDARITTRRNVDMRRRI